MSPVPRRGRGDEGATLVIAVVVMLVLSSLATAALARTLSTLRYIRAGQDFDGALAVADAGLSDALYRIDQTATARAAAPTFTGSGDTGQGSFTYRAIKRSDAEYEVRSIGTVGTSRHAIRARVTRSTRFPFALFSVQDLVFDGNSNANIYSFVTSAPNVPTGEARVGSDHHVVVGSGKGAGDEQHYFAPDGGCSGCPKPVAHPDERSDVNPVTAPTGATQNCPAGGTFTGTVNGGNGVPFVCRVDVTMTGTVTVSNGPLIIYVLPTAGTDPPVHHALDISNAVVNPSGHSTDVQVFKAGSALLDIGTGNTSSTMTFNGVMYAPESTVTVNGGKWWLGSWVINALNVNGAPNINIGYDLDTKAYYGIDWKISRYEEIASSAAAVAT